MQNSPENHELETVIRELGKSLRSYRPLDGQESWGWSSPVLLNYAVQNSISRRLLRLLDGGDFTIGGDEHRLYAVTFTQERFYKTTYGEAYGCSTYFSREDPELTGKHFHAQANSDPLFYLQRWFLLNLLTEFQTKFEGILPPEERGRFPLICLSQPVLVIDNPGYADVKNAFRTNGYLEIAEDAYIHRETGILLTDAAVRNVRIVDGKPVPFDAIAQVPSQRMLHWIFEKTGEEIKIATNLPY